MPLTDRDVGPYGPVAEAGASALAPLDRIGHEAEPIGWDRTDPAVDEFDHHQLDEVLAHAEMMAVVDTTLDQMDAREHWDRFRIEKSPPEQHEDDSRRKPYPGMDRSRHLSGGFGIMLISRGASFVRVLELDAHSNHRLYSDEYENDIEGRRRTRERRIDFDVVRQARAAVAATVHDLHRHREIGADADDAWTYRINGLALAVAKAHGIGPDEILEAHRAHAALERAANAPGVETYDAVAMTAHTNAQLRNEDAIADMRVGDVSFAVDEDHAPWRITLCVFTRESGVTIGPGEVLTDPVPASMAMGMVGRTVSELLDMPMDSEWAATRITGYEMVHRHTLFRIADRPVHLDTPPDGVDRPWIGGPFE